MLPKLLLICRKLFFCFCFFVGWCFGVVFFRGVEYNKGSEVPAQVAWRGGRCPVPGNNQGQAGGALSTDGAVGICSLQRVRPGDL